MLDILVAVAGGLVVGLLMHRFVAWLLAGRRRRRPDGFGTRTVLQGDVIDSAADAWAEMRGQKAAAPLIAKKLALIVALNERRLRRISPLSDKRARRQVRRWWR